MATNQHKVVLITGANGFIGSQLLADTKNRFPHWKIKAISRSPVPRADSWLSFQEFKKGAFPPSFFSDVNHFVHLAAIAHRKADYDSHELESVNIGFLDEILEHLNSIQLEKVVFLSSLAVSLLEKNVVLDTVAYAKAKAKAEQHLKWFAQKRLGATEIVILRPPMVYGKDAPGNFESLVRLLALPVPLPFKSLRSPRTSIHLKNLTAAIQSILESPLQSGTTTFEISDPWKESLNQFISDLQKAVSGKAKLIPFPPSVLSFLFRIIGKGSVYEKLALETNIDNSAFLSRYSWTPPIRFEARFDDLRTVIPE